MHRLRTAIASSRFSTMVVLMALFDAWRLSALGTRPHETYCVLLCVLRCSLLCGTPAALLRHLYYVILR